MEKRLHGARKFNEYKAPELFTSEDGITTKYYNVE